MSQRFPVNKNTYQIIIIYLKIETGYFINKINLKIIQMINTFFHMKQQWSDKYTFCTISDFVGYFHHDYMLHIFQ